MVERCGPFRLNDYDTHNYSTYCKLFHAIARTAKGNYMVHTTWFTISGRTLVENMSEELMAFVKLETIWYG